MEGSQKTLIEENIEKIYEYLYLTSLDSNMINAINMFMNAYNQTLNEYLNAQNPSYELIQRLQILSGPVNFVYSNFPDNYDSPEPHPAADIIKNKINDYSTSLEKGFTRTRKNANIPSTIPEEKEYTQINGFTTAIIVVILTTIFGILLGALLFFIR